ncbi:MAG: FAD-dependent oxidoreductase [Alphaproteobacteria bacterium]|nr:FAD-dependent oxidoreductase [Alphaproteobacteria bacterium]
MRDSRYDILFEPIKIGPKTAKNRFFQVPHCNGMGHPMPSSVAAMREMKAEGGWAVISTEECEIHPSSDVAPYPEARLWDDHDIPALAKMCDAVHKYDALAAVELVHNGPACANLYSREVPLAPSHQPVNWYAPYQAKEMDKEDIKLFRKWHKDAALRAKKAGFDIIYVYAGHDLSLPMHFIQKRRNHRLDEYGGSLENRIRLLKEVIVDTKEAIGDSCAVAVRFAVDELLGNNGIVSNVEGREIIEMLAEFPDLWDVNISNWSNDSATSRFSSESFQEEYISFVKKITTKPVVGVGRFTSPDTMVSQLKRGILDMIGAARPSIADPFLPKKIEQGRLEDIRECIGCNICVSGDMTSTPIRCTQNPTIGEEWRRGWHPEIISDKKSDKEILIIGAGPAGLECARALGQRGYRVHLAEAKKELGGRLIYECRLPGLAEWIRVREYRMQQINKMPNVSIYYDSHLSYQDVIEFAVPHVIIATGSFWRNDGVGRKHGFPINGFNTINIYTPDDIMNEKDIFGPVAIFDDDHYYMGGVLAEKLAKQGKEVCIITPATSVSAWTIHTLEHDRIQKRLLELGVKLYTASDIISVDKNHIEIGCIYTGKKQKLNCKSLVSVTSRLPNNKLYNELKLEMNNKYKEYTLTAIGDCYAPATIAAAVYSGHKTAREFDNDILSNVGFYRELPSYSTKS